jgi:xanthine dehydrogenase accessory factor
MIDWASRALEAIARGEPAALVSVLAIEGSAPREAGARMLVTAEESVGSIGGGNLEFQAIAQARKALAREPGDWRIQDYPLGPFLQQCCGGRVRLLIERLDEGQADWIAAVGAPGRHRLETQLQPRHLSRRLVEETDRAPVAARGPAPQIGDTLLEVVGTPATPLLLFGAGHVGRAVARILEGLPFALDWHDDREGSDRAQMAALARSSEGAVLILTHDHALDYDLTMAALSGPAAFIGLIGSATKRARFLRRLAGDGFDEATLARLVCPIGLPGIEGKAPEVIAVAVAAQLLQTNFLPRT